MKAITGDKELDKKLRDLSTKGARKAMASGINASLTPIVKAIRAGVNASSASANLKSQARKAVGKRFVRGGTSRMGKTTAQVAKAGFGVGFSGKRRQKAIASAAGKSKSRGAGISIGNIHWPVLGTAQRRTKTGHPTGAMPRMFGGVVARAFMASKTASLEAARRKLAEVIRKEAQKKG